MTNLKSLARKHATQATLKWMQDQIDNMEKAAKDLREYKDRFQSAVVKEEIGEKDSATLVQHLSWFVNSATKTAAMNSRMDLAVNHASALALTQPKE
jgi:hypothetical protein